MTPITTRRFLARCGLVATLCAATVACGKKGPPLAPLHRLPQRVEELKARRLADELQLQFKVPSANTDGSTPADLDRVEAYAHDGEVVDERGRPLSNDQFVKQGTLVGQVAIEPPPVEPEEGEDAAEPRPPAAPPVDDPRPAQGELASIVDRALAARPPSVKRAPVTELPPVYPLSPFVGTPAPPDQAVTMRVYGIVSVSTSGRRGPVARTSVPLGEVPPAVGVPAVTHSANEIRVEWAPPEGARLPVQPAVEATLLAPKPLAAVNGTPTRYNVYPADRVASPAAPVVPVPKNATPLADAFYVERFTEYGIERCYTVRAVTALATVTIESVASPVACVTPEDTFPPAAPANLAAVAGEGVISLIWDPSADADVAGYVVLRGPADGGALEPLTPTPIRETTFRDASLVSGVRYVYAVVAVDASPRQNRSGESNRVEETAR